MNTMKVTPECWAKIQYLTSARETEISFMGRTKPGDPLYLEEVGIIEQGVTGAYTAMEGEGLLKWMKECQKQGYQACDCMRVWCHTHPWSETPPSPSGTDTNEMETVFGECNYGIMIIFGKNMVYRGEIWMNTPFKARLPLTLEIDWGGLVSEAKKEAWEKAIDQKVLPLASRRQALDGGGGFTDTPKPQYQSGGNWGMGWGKGGTYTYRAPDSKPETSQYSILDIVVGWTTYNEMDATAWSLEDCLDMPGYENSIVRWAKDWDKERVEKVLQTLFQEEREEKEERRPFGGAKSNKRRKRKKGKVQVSQPRTYPVRQLPSRKGSSSGRKGTKTTK